MLNFSEKIYGNSRKQEILSMGEGDYQKQNHSLEMNVCLTHKF
jgi:hypothetical protein